MNERHGEFWADLTARVSEESPILEDVSAILKGYGPIRSYFIRPETVFDQDSVFDSIGVFVLTKSHLIIVISDVTYELSPTGEFVTTTQVVQLSQIRDFQVVRRRVLDGPERGALGTVQLRFRWGAGWAADIRPASCDDPTCEADHGYLAMVSGDDGEILLEPTLDPEILAQALRFIDELTACLAAKA